MNLSLNGDFIADDKSSLRERFARAWAEEHLYCSNCSSPKLKWQDEEPGDFTCPRCHSQFQLKGQRTPIGSSIAAGAYGAMMRTVRSGNGPSYFVMDYNPVAWTVRNLLLVPHFAITPGAIVKRKGTAGCRLALNRLPADARIAIITTIRTSSGGDTECLMIARPEEVREKFRRLKSASAKSKN